MSEQRKVRPKAAASRAPRASSRQIEGSVRAAFGGHREPRRRQSARHETGHPASSRPAHSHHHHAPDVSRTPTAVRPAGKTKSSYATHIGLWWVCLHRRVVSVEYMRQKGHVSRVRPIRGPSRRHGLVDGCRRGCVGPPRRAVLWDRPEANHLAVLRARRDIRRRSPS